MFLIRGRGVKKKRFTGRNLTFGHSNQVEAKRFGQIDVPEVFKAVGYLPAVVAAVHGRDFIRLEMQGESKALDENVGEM